MAIAKLLGEHLADDKGQVGMAALIGGFNGAADLHQRKVTNVRFVCIV